MQGLTCPQCAGEMKKVYFDIGKCIIVRTYTCLMCGFNITDERHLDKCIRLLKYY